MGKTITRRSFLKAGGGALVGAYALTLVGCGGSGGQGGGEQGTATVVVQLPGGSEDSKLHQQVLEMFGERNEDVRARLQPVVWDSYFDKLSTQAAGGSLPDVVLLTISSLAEYAGREVVYDMSEFVGDAIDLDGFVPAAVEGSKWGPGDGVFGIPVGMHSPAMMYDTVAVEEAGVSLPDDASWTWDELASFANEYAEAAGEGVYGLLDAGGRDFALEIFVRQRGKDLYTPEGQLGFERSDLTDWWTYWQELRESGAAATEEDLTAGVGSANIASPLVAKKVAMQPASSCMELDSEQSETDRELGLLLMPGGTEGSVREGQYVNPVFWLSASAKSANPEAAARVINFFANDEGAARTLGTMWGLPPSKENQVVVEAQADAVGEKLFRYLERATDKSSPLTVPYPQGAGEITEDLLRRLNQEVSLGELSVDEAVDQFFSEAERVL